MSQYPVRQDVILYYVDEVKTDGLVVNRKIDSDHCLNISDEIAFSRDSLVLMPASESLLSACQNLPTLQDAGHI